MFRQDSHTCCHLAKSSVYLIQGQSWQFSIFHGSCGWLGMDTRTRQATVKTGWCQGLVPLETVQAQGKHRLHVSKRQPWSPSCYCWLFPLEWGWNILTICSWWQTKRVLFLSSVSCGWSCLHACPWRADAAMWWWLPCCLQQLVLLCCSLRICCSPLLTQNPAPAKRRCTPTGDGFTVTVSAPAFLILGTIDISYCFFVAAL